MTEQDLRDELVTLLTDGPTSALLCWSFEWLLRRPEELDRLREEVLCGESEEYLDAVLKETLRLCPAAPIVVRRILEPMTVGSYELPAGSTVAPCVHVVHRREDLYPEPRKPAGIDRSIRLNGAAARPSGPPRRKPNEIVVLAPSLSGESPALRVAVSAASAGAAANTIMDRAVAKPRMSLPR